MIFTERHFDFLTGKTKVEVFMKQVSPHPEGSCSRGDAIRVAARGLIPVAVYRRMSELLNMWAVLQREGLAAWRLLSQFDGALVTHQFRSLQCPFRFRRIPSHVGVIIQNVFRREYCRFPARYTPRVIIDGGAFIGDLTCLWASQFPHARIIGLEPNADSFELARLNSSCFGERVTLLQAGLWSECRRLQIVGVESSTRVLASKSGDGMVEAIDLGTLLKKFSLDRVDILKLDIEGAEEEVLSERCIPWLGRISCIIVEFHGGKIEDEITPRLTKAGFTARRFRSLVYFTKPSHKV
ncbi:MAG: FkbM family methyltransferase [Verrucomicrobiota bacterium]